MKRAALIMLILFVILPGCGHADVPAGTPSQELRVLFFDAGKADCILLRTAHSTVLIDTGKNKFGDRIVEYCAGHGIDLIDAMFITHFDKDHVGGADAVLEGLGVGVVYEPDYAGGSKQYRQYREALAGSSARLETLKKNASFVLDGVTYDIDVANETDYGPDEENDFSLVISVRFGDVSFLMAGDAENPRLGELLAEGVAAHTVLKVPHHGRAEKLSGAFFEAVSPRYAVITSDGENLEEPEVVSLLGDMGTEVLLTREGPVYCVTDGTELTVTRTEP